MQISTGGSIFKDFLNSNKASGILLLIAVFLSLIIANSTLSNSFANLLSSENHLFENSNSALKVSFSISALINDLLMAVFFLMVGLEIKRELVSGELSSIKSASLPVVAALGGMIVPALVYFAINKDTASAHGWGIPMATDIAFALAIISLLGNRIPLSLKIFLAALAIVDDLGAILVIAFFYTETIHLNYLLMAGGVTLLLFLLNYLGVKKLIFYLIPGILLWYLIHHSGIHATIAGVLLAFTIPTNTKTSSESPLTKLEHILVKPVNFIIMPLFALANTNITFNIQMLKEIGSPLSLGIVAGLFLGKTLGVTLFSWGAVKIGWGTLPSGAGWKHIIGLGMLAGIGFTMSIFIALLSFSDKEMIETAKFAVLVASAISAIAGFIYLSGLAKKKLTR